VNFTQQDDARSGKIIEQCPRRKRGTGGRVQPLCNPGFATGRAIVGKSRIDRG
jgi:hypothetical protein